MGFRIACLPTHAVRQCRPEVAYGLVWHRLCSGASEDHPLDEQFVASELLHKCACARHYDGVWLWACLPVEVLGAGGYVVWFGWGDPWLQAV